MPVVAAPGWFAWHLDSPLVLARPAAVVAQLACLGILFMTGGNGGTAVHERDR